MNMLAIAMGRFVLTCGNNAIIGERPLSLVEAGKLKLLATYNDVRIKRFADVPTVKGLGYGVIHNSPIGIVGPKGMTDKPLFSAPDDLPVFVVVHCVAAKKAGTGDSERRRVRDEFMTSAKGIGVCRVETVLRLFF
jgi:hypothetical protein